MTVPLALARHKQRVHSIALARVVTRLPACMQALTFFFSRLPISLVLPLQLLFIITCAAVTQGTARPEGQTACGGSWPLRLDPVLTGLPSFTGKVAIQSSPTLSGYPITVSCIKGQANGENSPPSVTWIMNGLAIDFWATKYDRFSSSVVSAGSTTLYHLTIDPSDRGDNNATVSCQLQGYPPSEETRLVIYGTRVLTVKKMSF